MTFLSGCSVYSSRYTFDPRPVDVELAVPGAPDSEPVRTLVSVVGVRRADAASQLPASVEVRLRVENTSSYPARFDPESLALFSGGLDRFPDPIVRPAEPLDLAPNEIAVVEAYFPFPDDRKPSDLDLGGLNVRFTVQIDGHPVTRSASFTIRPVYYERYHYGVGMRYGC